MAKFFIEVLFGLRYNDVTNAFKCYRREAIQVMRVIEAGLVSAEERRDVAL